MLFGFDICAGLPGMLLIITGQWFSSSSSVSRESQNVSGNEQRFGLPRDELGGLSLPNSAAGETQGLRGV
jgi:hypothetical protein